MSGTTSVKNALIVCTEQTDYFLHLTSIIVKEEPVKTYSGT